MRRRCVDFEETKVHDRKPRHGRSRRGDYVGDSPKMTRFRKRRTNRRERREGRQVILGE